jgi:predicted ATP-dependent serine protease
VDGIANSRLLLLLAVLQKRCGVFMSRQDVYINVVGRMRLDRGEGNAADLAIAVSLVSSLASIAVRSDTAFVGEVGLLGELRLVGSLDKRVQEARRMGFSRIITPRNGKKRRQLGQRTQSTVVKGIEWLECDTLLDAINSGLVHALPKGRRRNSAQTGGVQGSREARREILDDEDDEFDAFL